MLDFDDTKAISTVNVKTITKAQLEMQGKAVVDKVGIKDADNIVSKYLLPWFFFRFRPWWVVYFGLHKLQYRNTIIEWRIWFQEIDDKVSNFFGQCDLNKDGQITEDEFIKSGSKVSEIFELED